MMKRELSTLFVGCSVRVCTLAVSFLAMGIVLIGAGTVAWAAEGPSLVYNRDIRPILSENCFACHGPDKNKRQAGLRLDVREEALGHQAIVPGKPQESKLIARILATDTDMQMPPAATHKQLTAAQKETLRRWIAAGATYQPH